MTSIFRIFEQPLKYLFMVIKIFIFILFLCIPMSLNANNFPDNFQAAMKLYNSKKYTEAEKFFAKLSRWKVAQLGIDASLAYAALSAAHNKNYEKAEEYVVKIKNGQLKMLCRMNFLAEQKKESDIIKIAEKENLETWPDRLIYDASFLRGKAYLQKKELQLAEKDLLTAKKATMNYWNIYYTNKALRTLYRRLKEYDKAGAIAKDIKERRYKDTVRYAAFMVACKRFKRALAKLDRLKVDSIKSAYWRSVIYECYGDVYENFGKNDKALFFYRKAVETPADNRKISDDNIRQKIVRLEKTINKDKQ